MEFNESLAFLFEPARLKIAYGGRGAIICAGIYCIYNKITGKFYIGSSYNCRKRWILHKHRLRLNAHDNKYFQAAWNKYGEENFEFIIIEICENLKEILENREQYWIDLTDCCNRLIGYNLALKANSQLGVKRSQETKNKISDKIKGIKRIFSEEHKINLSKAAMYVVKTEDHKLKVAAANRLRCRDTAKWPHEKGNRCICDECKNKKRIMQLNRRAKLNGD